MDGTTTARRVTLRTCVASEVCVLLASGLRGYGVAGPYLIHSICACPTS